jgi:hypothetical protein
MAGWKVGGQYKRFNDDCSKRLSDVHGILRDCETTTLIQLSGAIKALHSSISAAQRATQLFPEMQ